MRFLVPFSLALLSFSSHATTIIVDFQNASKVVDPNNSNLLYSVHDSGFSFDYSGEPGGGAINDGLRDWRVGYDPTIQTALTICTLGPGLDCTADNNVVATMTADNGLTFDLQSFEITGNRFDGNQEVYLTGYSQTSGFLSMLIGDYVPHADDIFGLTTLNFSSEWSDLEYINIETEIAIVQLDNILVSQVPVPAAVWLFGSALAGLGWMRRKKPFDPHQNEYQKTRPSVSTCLKF
jgi:hypothetical protein